MDISITVHNLDLTPRLQSHVEKKMGRLDRYLPNLSGVQVDLSVQNARSAGERHIAQVTIRDTRGTILRAEERNSDMFSAVDTVIDKIYKQIKRYRGKQLRQRRTASEEAVLLDWEVVEDEEEFVAEERTIVRRKQFSVRPMPPDEAVEQMELLGHDFFVFFNADVEAINVLYRRHDGNYGLLHPELD
jgi:putative sigma-54 modulation protein